MTDMQLVAELEPPPSSNQAVLISEKPATGQMVGVLNSNGNGVSTVSCDDGKSDVMDRERLMNDLANTGVVAALFGGFALSTLSVDLDQFGAGKISTSELLQFAGSALWFISFCSAHLWYTPI